MPKPLTPAERQRRARKKRKKAGMVRYDLAVPGVLHRKLRARARQQKIPMKAMVVAILESETG